MNKSHPYLPISSVPPTVPLPNDRLPAFCLYQSIDIESNRAVYYYCPFIIDSRLGLVRCPTHTYEGMAPLIRMGGGGEQMGGNALLLLFGGRPGPSPLLEIHEGMGEVDT